ncbi:MAG: ATP-binding protein [Oligoflexales bacterium]
MSDNAEENEDLIDDLDGADQKSGEDLISVLGIIERESIHKLVLDFKQEFTNISINNFQHSESGSYEPLFEVVDLLIIECRIIGLFSDLQTIREIRTQRPLMPIIMISENMDSEVMLMAYKEGVNDYIPTTTTKEVLAAKIKSFYKMAKSAKLVEVQNEQLVSTMKSLREANNELRQEATSRVVAEAERDMADEIAKIHKQNKEILDNLTSGFFTIKKDTTIGMTTSKACEAIFSNQIAGKKIGDIFNLIEGQEAHLVLALEQLFEDIMPFEVNVSLLRKQFCTLDGKIIDFHYTTIFNMNNDPAKIIVVATDITETVLKQKEMQRNVNLNQALINIITNVESFSSFLTNYRQEISLMKESTNVKDLKRGLHTLKGNSSIFGLEEIFKRIHQMETSLTAFGSDNYEACREIRKYAYELEDMMRQFLVSNRAALQLEYDKEQIEHFKFEKVHIDTLYELCNALDNDLRKKFETVLDYHKHCPISLFTAIYKNVVRKLSAQLDKKIELSIIGQELRIEKKTYEPIFENLVHALTNACDHGIEPPVLRTQVGKPQTGQIEIKFEKSFDKEMLITIKDDGGGIDVEKLTVLAIKKKIFDIDEASKKPPEAILELIFHDGLSTANEVSHTSGRGVGMPALKKAVEDLKGKIKISSEKNQGSVITLVIPNVF